jgi:CubicO group peptidase (beta-lactamase class C family)/D-alanyl-D-alanine dipeptidase
MIFRYPKKDGIRSKRLGRGATILVGLFYIGGAAAFLGWAQNVAPSLGYNVLTANLARFIRHEMADKGLPAISIALVNGQRIVWAQGFGYADPEQKIAATAQTEYRVGSVSKLFTDLAVMQLVERGKLNLDAPITSYLPDFHPHNPFATPITLRELMAHRAGVLREPPVGNYFDSRGSTLDACIHSLNQTTQVYRPGSHTKYSNAGVAVVGYVLENVEHQPFAAYLKRALLEPMGLDESAFTPEPRLVRHLAKAFMWSYDGLVAPNAQPYEQGARDFPAPTFQLGMSPAGSMYSTVNDLGRFLEVLFAGGRGPHGQVIQPATLEQMWTPQFVPAGERNGFGIGFHVSQFRGHRLVGHDGAIYGFATTLAALPSEKIGAVAATTMDSANGVTDHIVMEALRLMLAQLDHRPLPSIETTQPVPASEAQRLAGRYGTGTGAVDLFDEEGELYLLSTRGGSQLRLRKLGADLITDSRLAYGLKITRMNEAVEIRKKVLHRVAIPRPKPAPAQWKGLIGEYGWPYDTLYIIEKNGHLTALIEWFEYDPLKQKSANVFDFPRRGLYDGEKAIFTRNSSGLATQVRVSGVVFRRIPIGAAEGAVFHIRPVQPVSVLRRMALAAQPPHLPGQFLKPDLVDVTTLDPTIKLDIRYATSRDFLGQPVYKLAKAYLQRPAAEALVRVSHHLHQVGYGLLIHDAYRPWFVTKIFWDATPANMKIFVADPRAGSRHNRGCAVDLTLYSLKDGKAVPMTGGYDEMSERSYPFYPGGTSLERWDRNLLGHAMLAEGFKVYEFEWWHFDYKDWRNYPIMNVSFSALAARGR